VHKKPIASLLTIRLSTVIQLPGFGEPIHSFIVGKLCGIEQGRGMLVWHTLEALLRLIRSFKQEHQKRKQSQQIR
jgi:hypothetical protein